MPAGDLILEDYQLELRAELMGRDSDVHFDQDRGGVSGLFDDPVTPSETEYAHADGSFIGTVRNPPRTVTAALVVVGATEAAVAADVVAMRTAWAKSADPTVDVELWFQWPGFGKGYVLGQPLGLQILDYTKALILRRVPILGTFRVTDPTIHT